MFKPSKGGFWALYWEPGRQLTETAKMNMVCEKIAVVGVVAEEVWHDSIPWVRR